MHQVNRLFIMTEHGYPARLGMIPVMERLGEHGPRGRVIGVSVVILVRTTAPGDPSGKASP
jgi:hypothetical protein